eukprot:symbB.v1.2.026754.t2/scaffold2681.1/size73127/3
MSRALMTSNIAYAHLINQVPFIAHEGCKEKSHGNACDYRRSATMAKADFPNVDFSLIEEEDPLLSTMHHETDLQVAQRAYDFMLWIRNRTEKEIVVSTHSAWLFNLFNAVLKCDDPQLAEWFVNGELRSVEELDVPAKQVREKQRAVLEAALKKQSGPPDVRLIRALATAEGDGAANMPVQEILACRRQRLLQCSHAEVAEELVWGFLEVCLLGGAGHKEGSLLEGAPLELRGLPIPGTDPAPIETFRRAVAETLAFLAVRKVAAGHDGQAVAALERAELACLCMAEAASGRSSKALELVRGLATWNVFGSEGDPSFFASIWKARCRLGARGALRALQQLGTLGLQLPEALQPLAQTLDALEDPCDAFDKPPAGHFCAMLRAGGGRLRNWCADELQRSMGLNHLGVLEPEMSFEELEPFLLSFRTEEARKESVLRLLDLLGAPTLSRHPATSRYRQSFLEAFAPLSLRFSEEIRIPPYGMLPACAHREAMKTHTALQSLALWPREALLHEVLVDSLRRLSSNEALKGQASKLPRRVLRASEDPRLYFIYAHGLWQSGYLGGCRGLRGDVFVGSMRVRMPIAEDFGMKDLQVQVHYPGKKDAPLMMEEKFPFMRTEVTDAIGESKGIPTWVLKSLFKGSTQLDPCCEPSTSSKWPIVIFSSGIWGSCEMYTQYLRDLASFGMVVISIEHEDGSGIFAVNSEGKTLPYQEPPPDVDTATFRQPNLQKRSKEINAIVHSIKNLCGESSTPLAKVIQQTDADCMALVGHSLGAAGAWRYLRTEGRQCPFRFVLLMDLWPAALLEEDFAFTPAVNYAIILSEEWMNSPKFLAGNQKLIALSQNGGGKCLAALQSQGTSHQWISETQMILPFWMLRRSGLMGHGDWYRIYAATVHGSAHLLAAGLGGRTQEALEEIEKLESEGLKPIGFTERNDL